jgi:hypothetical protein
VLEAREDPAVGEALQRVRLPVRSTSGRQRLRQVRQAVREEVAVVVAASAADATVRPFRPGITW